MTEAIFLHPWVWIIPAVLLLLLAFTAWTIVRAITHDGDWFIATGFAGAAFVGLAIGLFAGMLPPYDASYYQTYRISGEVAALERAMDGDSGTFSQSFVVEVDGVDLLIHSEDQRLRTYDVGDDVNLVCAKGFAYFVEPWYGCSIGGR